MAASSESVFRKAALERLSSPEQLDQMVTLTSPIGWLAALALAILTAAAVAWSIFGAVPISVYGSGILVTRGGHVFDAMAPAEGTLITAAEIGTAVKKGDLLATLDDTQLQQDLLHAKTVVAEKQAELSDLTGNFQRQLDLKRQNTAAQKSNLGRIIDAAQQRNLFYKTLLDRITKVASQGFITQRYLEETRREMELADQESRHARSDLIGLDADVADLEARRDLAILTAQQAVSEAGRHVDELAIELSQATRILSPLDGVVTELKASPGSVVAQGKPILSIETAGSGLELLLYVPPETGKKVTPGMEVRIEPATVKKEEFGTLIGKVLDVSDFPMTAEGMLSVLQNARLVDQFMAEGPPYAVRVMLVADSAAGYRWSGGKAPPVRLSSGTTARAAITVARQAPASFLIPMLRGQAGFSS